MRKTLVLTALVGVVLIGPTGLYSQENKPSDNTRVNRRDRSSAEVTADQGKNNVSDREIMQRIRRSVLDDKALSTYAHNVKIIAQDGRVTLKGPVRSEEEGHAVEQKARGVAGEGHVVNELTVKPKRTT